MVHLESEGTQKFEEAIVKTWNFKTAQARDRCGLIVRSRTYSQTDIQECCQVLRGLMSVKMSLGGT